jgi:hypothetical protein
MEGTGREAPSFFGKPFFILSSPEVYDDCHVWGVGPASGCKVSICRQPGSWRIQAESDLGGGISAMSDKLVDLPRTKEGSRRKTRQTSNDDDN